MAENKSILQRFYDLPASWKALLIIQALLLICGIIIFITAFTFTVNLTGSTFITDIGFLTSLFENLALSGGVSVLVVNIFGGLGSYYRKRPMIILYIIGCVCCMIILFVCGIIPEIAAAVLNTTCNAAALANCYKCPDGQPADQCTTAAQDAHAGCWYNQNDFNALCVDFREKVNLVIAFFFISGVLSFGNSICSCIALSHIERFVSQTVVVVQTTTATPPPQQQPYMTPYPPQQQPTPYPPQQQPYMTPYPPQQQPYMTAYPPGTVPPPYVPQPTNDTTTPPPQV